MPNSDKAGTLKFGPLGTDTAHVCVDMQRIFGEKTGWHTPHLKDIVTNTMRLIAHAPERTVFTRFRTPNSPEDLPGQWQRYYERWDEMLAGRLPDDMFGIIPDFRAFVPPAVEVDKLTYNGFASPELVRALDRLQASTLIFSGVETEVCVLATLLGAVDLGYRAVLVKDAVTSGNLAAHKAGLEVVFSRYDQQIEVCDTDTVLENWRTSPSVQTFVSPRGLSHGQ